MSRLKIAATVVLLIAGAAQARLISNGPEQSGGRQDRVVGILSIKFGGTAAIHRT